MRNEARERAWEKRVRRVGEWVEALSEGRGTTGLEGATLAGISVRMPTESQPETLLVIKARIGEDKYVAFCGALELAGALLAWRAKDGGKGLRWRVDVPWGERESR